MRPGSALLALAAVAVASSSRAQAPVQVPVIDEAQAAQLEALRAEVAGQIHLSAFELVDELVFEWTQRPPFDAETPVVLADVSVPLTLGTGLQALIENHFASVVLHHPRSKVTLAHCPECTAMIVHSGAKGTVVSRGVDAPDALEKIAGTTGARHALFLDFEAEGSSLVLRARITRLSRELPIVFARTLTTSTATPALLRNEEHLVSAAEARKQYLDALEGKGVLVVPVKLAVRSYAIQEGSNVALPPFVWLEAGVEAGLSQARAWTASFTIGYSWAPELHDGWMAQARFARLISGKARSLTHPDIYLFTGGAVLSLRGADTILFRPDPVSAADIIAANQGSKPQITFAAWQLGLELRVKDRIGAAVYLESLPGIGQTENLGNFVDFIFQFQSIGVEVSFCF